MHLDAWKTHERKRKIGDFVVRERETTLGKSSGNVKIKTRCRLFQYMLVTASAAIFNVSASIAIFSTYTANVLNQAIAVSLTDNQILNSLHYFLACDIHSFTELKNMADWCSGVVAAST